MSDFNIQLPLAIFAWNAYVEGRKVSRLVYSRAELPMPKVL